MVPDKDWKSAETKKKRDNIHCLSEAIENEMEKGVNLAI